MVACGAPPIDGNNQGNTNNNTGVKPDPRTVKPTPVAVVKASTTIRLKATGLKDKDGKLLEYPLSKDKETKVKPDKFQVLCQKGFLCPLGVDGGKVFVNLQDGDKKTLAPAGAEIKLKPNFDAGFTTKVIDLDLNGKLSGEDYVYPYMDSPSPGSGKLHFNRFCVGLGTVVVTKVGKDHMSFEAKTYDTNARVQATVKVRPTEQVDFSNFSPEIAAKYKAVMDKYPGAFLLTANYSDRNKPNRPYVQDCLLQKRTDLE